MGVGGGGGAPGSFLTMKEAGPSLVEMASTDMHEKFSCRLHILSLNLLRVIAEQDVSIEELNTGKVRECS
ncbi:hypothetical protein KC19_5G080500 [Ceratodon purpureus]|uniref:Uncharacterized protein n=1 Tax=Ceratodon purpureus TaxID=3225 RepID=A0A8T0I0L1_CERPU|nr:hypothetical protein KC19_5G080500 [Ceratodon purpureus]